MNQMKHTTLICIFFLALTSVVEAQQLVTGRITDADEGHPLVGAHIFIANTTIGTTSDASGNYKLTIPGVGNYEITVSYVGYEPFIHKIDMPKPSHQIDVALKIKELPEVVVTAPRNFRRRDVNLFWRTLLGVNPSRRGLEILNSERVFFYLNSDNVLKVYCDEPIEIVNHEMGYHIQYVLKNFQHDYNTDEADYEGSSYFRELIPQNDRQKNSWEKKRQDVYPVSITCFIRALYRQQIHEEGFLLVKRDESRRINTPFPLPDILKADGNPVTVTIDSPLYLGCFAQPVTKEMIENSNNLMFVYKNETFPVLKFFPQQISIFADGTYSGKLEIQELRSRISGLSMKLPIEYALNR